MPQATEGPDDPGGVPLAARMRPGSIGEFVGQGHILGPGRLLRRAIQADQLSSLIFHGPPGTGKTTLAHVIANTTRSHFISINAVLSGVKDIREAIATAQERRSRHGQRTILFVDEVHRWNKAQQDALLPWVENGTVILIGATTENPFFSVNRPLVSRSRIFQLRPLTEGDLRVLVQRALEDRDRGYGLLRVEILPEAVDHLVHVGNGDARAVLNALELAVETTPPGPDGVVHIDRTVAEESIQQRAVLYDRDGDIHYDTISAFIKSLRGSDPDAALYWLARMVYAGEDPRFLFRRMLILASEDIGLADPAVLSIVVACAEAFDRVGLPEGRFHLAHAALTCATAPKSNATLAFFDALKVVEEEREGEIPSPLRDASRDKEGFGHGEGYLYPHAFKDHWVAQRYLPAELQGRVFYQPSDQGREREIKEVLARRREALVTAMIEGEVSAPGEILTFSPEDRGLDRWLQRTIGQSGEHLAQVRDRVLGGASLERHSLVLDLQAGTGLLLWEALRRTPEGGIFGLCQDPTALRSLRARAGELPSLRRPVFLEGPLEALQGLLEKSGHGDIRFDAAIGRNAFVPCRERTRAARAISGCLRPSGLLSLVETLPRRTQRLYALPGVLPVNDPLALRWREAEEALYADPRDPRVAWDQEDLLQTLREGGLHVLSSEVLEQSTELRLTEAMLSRWFPHGDPAGAREGRLSYAQRLLAFLSEEEVQALARRLTVLKGQILPWKSSLLFVTARRPLA